MDLPIRRSLHPARSLALCLTLLLPVTAALAQRRPAPPPPAAPPGNHPPPAQPPPPAPQAAVGNLGQPLSGLTNDQLADFLDGQADFTDAETAADGLGPIFNNVSCVACHSGAAPGGASNITTTRFGRTTNGVFDALEPLGGSLLQARALAPNLLEHIPAAANTVARRLTPPVFGAGLIDAIDDATIQQFARQPKPAGIKGRAAIVRDVASNLNRVGRFGWKAQQATVLAFAGDAYNNEMGITNRLFPTENAPNGNVALIAAYIHNGVDDQPDPATGRADIDRVALFMEYLAAPNRAPSTPASRAGEQIFTRVSCAACHNPSYRTGRNSIAALSQQNVPLYSDLLLHDMGALGDGIAQGDAGPREMRTPPLWGLRARHRYLHDGRTQSLDAAIRAHAGEATSSRDAYVRLSGAEQQALLAFLNTL